MAAFAEFLHKLLYDGQAVLREPPGPASERDPEASELLRQAYAEYGLDIAGPPLPFDLPVASEPTPCVARTRWR